MGMTGEDITQDFAGIATCWNESAPYNIALLRRVALKQLEEP